MRLKSYYSETVEAAMELARRDLGDEALLVNARPAMPDQLHLGDYEVVFGVSEESAPPMAESGSEIHKAQDEQSLRADSATPLVKRWMPPDHQAEPNTDGRLKEAIPAPDVEAVAVPDEIAPPRIQRERESAGLGDEIADLRRVVAALAARIPAGDAGEGDSRSVNSVPTPRIDPTLGVAGAARKIVALVGPAGVGKTTTLVKLAISQGLAANRSVQLITTDVHRVGAASHLRSIASVLGLACRSAESAEALEQLLEDTPGDLLLIDTLPDLSSVSGLSECIAQHPEIDTHLVLAASMSDVAMAAAEAAFRASKPNKFILTKLDELSQESSFVEQVQRAGSCSGLPLSFFAASPEIPNGLEAATEARLTGSGAAQPIEMRATA